VDARCLSGQPAGPVRDVTIVMVLMEAHPPPLGTLVSYRVAGLTPAQAAEIPLELG